MDLKISDSSFLDEIPERSVCPKCQSSRRFFCYDCCQLMPPLLGRVPKIKLPVNLHIVRHPMEKSGKSTGVHASLLAPDNVMIYLKPNFPDYSLLKDKVVLVYPRKDAKTLQSTENDKDLLDFLKKVENFVFIDCTWNQTSGMLQDERLAELPCVALTSYSTQFWRPNKKNKKLDERLATIEAVYYFCLEYRKYVLNESEDSYSGEYDNLLFFYEYFRKMVAEAMKNRKRPVDNIINN